MQPTTYIQLDKRYKNADGKYHAKLWVTFRVVRNGKKAWDQQPYVTGVFLTQDEFDRMMDDKVKTKQPDLIDHKKLLRALQAKADSLIEKFKIIDQKRFDLFFLSEHNIETVAGVIEYRVKKCMEHRPKPQVSSAEKYKTAYASFREFFGYDFAFAEVTPEVLQDYQAWYTEPYERRTENKDKTVTVTWVKPSLTSVGINCRYLRSAFNTAIKLNVIPPDLYPFGKDGYTIPETDQQSIELLESYQATQFLAYSPADDQTQFYYDMAVFSFFANGINPMDICSLRWDRIFEDKIEVLRSKTEGRGKKVRKIEIPMHARMRDIIRRHGVRKINGTPQDFVFPMFTAEMTIEQQFHYNRNVLVKNINHVLKKIATENKWHIKPTCYDLRHLFSQQVLEMGATTEQLQEMLGHGSVKTTEHYKNGFKFKVKQKFSEGLGNFG